MARAKPTSTPAAKIPLATTLRPTRAMQVQDAQSLLAQLLPYSTVRANLMNKHNISSATAEKVIVQARKIWAQEELTDPAVLRQEFLNAYRKFYNKAMADGAHGPARAALRDLTILSNINPEIQAQQRAADALEGAMQVDPERIRARVAVLVAAQAAKPTPDPKGTP